MNIICAADLHLGRHVTAPGGPKRSYTALAWERLVERCLADDPPIDALLLAGDLVDNAGLFIEMFGLLRKGIAKLVADHIPVIAIAGNHDARLLDQFNRTLGLKGFHLLGANGEWERFTLHCRNKVLHIDALSFTQSTMSHNPLLSCPKENVPAGELLIGLLHCDVDVANSRYAPVRCGDFVALPHTVWILGHNHTYRQLHRQNPLSFYCGSLQGLDITEEGLHGACLLELTPYRSFDIKVLELAPLRWEKVTLDLTTLNENDWQGELLALLESTLSNKLADAQGIEIVGVRLSLVGRSALFSTLQREVTKLHEQESPGVSLQGKWIPYFIESIDNKILPTRNLAKLADGSDLIAALARQLQRYEAGEPLPKSIYSQLHSKFQAEPYLKQCSSAWPNEEECRELFLSQGHALLDELLTQKGN